jgi:hypothetical protein
VGRLAANLRIRSRVRKAWAASGPTPSTLDRPGVDGECFGPRRIEQHVQLPHRTTPAADALAQFHTDGAGLQGVDFHYVRPIIGCPFRGCPFAGIWRVSARSRV